MNNIIKRVWNQNRLVNIEDLTGMVFQAEADGHTFEISGVDDEGNAVALSGSVAGVFRRPDNADIALIGSDSDGVVSVTLDENCYAVPGRFALTIFVTSSGQTVAVYACVGTVAATSGGSVAGDTPADVVDLVNAINAAVAAIPSDYSELQKTVDDIQTSILSDNLADPSSMITGSLKTDGTVDTTATGYVTSGYIEIEQNTDYTVSGWNNYIRTSRKYVALYDGDRQFIPGTHQNVNGQQFVSFNSGSAKYARASCASGNTLFVKKGSTGPDTFVAYSKTYESEMLSKEYKPGTIPPDALSTTLNHLLVHNEAVELYDSADTATGELLDTAGGTQTSTSYNTSGFIPVVAGKYYFVSTVRLKAFYTEANEGSFIEGSYDNTNHRTGETFLCAYTGYMRFSFANTESNVSVKTSFEGTPTKKIEEGVSLSDFNKAQVQGIVSEGNILYGKKWAVCGDSFTNSGGTGTVMPVGTKYAGEPYTYPWIIGSRQNMDIVKFFEGGRTLAFPAQPGTFENSLTNPNADWYYQNIPADADYITIYLGINDEHHAPSGSSGDGEDTTGEIPLGTVNDATTSTYLGAWNVVLTWLITNRPNAHIGMIVTNGIAGNDLYRQGQIAIAEKYGIPYIDMNGDARTPAMLRTSNPNVAAAVKAALIQKWAVNPGTNEHPNDAAQLFESSFIENFLRSI